MTAYRMYIQDGQYRTYVGSYFPALDADVPPQWVWTNDVKRAVKFAGRGEAETAAVAMERKMRAGGYNPSPFKIVPVTGGMEIARNQRV